MGSNSPIDIYNFAHHHIPFFSYIRTPSRFLLFTCFAYAVLAGLATRGIIEWLKRSRYSQLFPIVAVFLTLLLLSNTWQESREAFDTFELTDDQQKAIEWLSEQDKGRVLIIPLGLYIWSPELRSIYNPLSYTRMHHQETVSNGETKWTEAVIEDIHIMTGPQWDHGTSIAGISDIMGIKYAAVDKTNPLSSNYGLDDSFIRVWDSETIDIYKNKDPYPRVFLDIPTYEETHLQGWTWGEGSQYPAQVTLDYEHVRSDDHSWKSDYTFDKEGFNWLIINTPIQIPQDMATFSFWYYLPEPLPDVEIFVTAWESDGSRYESTPILDTAQGWHKIEIPLSFLWLRWSEDENMRLDNSQISQIGIGVSEMKGDEEVHEFSIYFSEISVHTHEIAEVDFSLIHPGKYKVHLEITEPCQLILNESYHPGWVARIDGEITPSERAYEYANSWQISQPGEYELILEFTSSGQRKVGRIISLLTLVGLIAFFTVQGVKDRWLARS